MLLDILLYAPSPDGEYPTLIKYKQISDEITVGTTELRDTKKLTLKRIQISSVYSSNDDTRSERLSHPIHSNPHDCDLYPLPTFVIPCSEKSLISVDLCSAAL